MAKNETEQTAAKDRAPLTAAEIGALAHLYRGEIYRSTVWRTRLDTTTNWSVVTLGVALSISFSSPGASPLPLILVGVLIIFFLMLEARRYRYFNVFRARARWMETHFYTPMLKEGDLHLEEHWQDVLAADYLRPEYHVGVMTAIGRRIRRNYFWILLIQSLAYAGKIAVHPTGVTSLQQAVARADIGPFPGELVLGTGLFYVLLWGGIAWWSTRTDAARARKRSSMTSMG
ncbi:DUF2270 domain-containing protein [Leisingera aquimarina]|uniref:DUF2270 domain-containing protein n=1 Tax=Leisingera aquimarina TaxID=476529 RepID=UPI0004258A3D|nr:DUF2270 domain-containing protein [Leisingera aquimarina]